MFQKVLLFLCLSLSLNLCSADIFYAIRTHDVKAVKMWLKENQGNDLINNFTNQEGQNTLHAAVYAGKRKILKEIIKAGALINALDCKHKTALDCAVEYGHDDIVLYLIQHSGKAAQQENADYIVDLVQNRRYIECLKLALKVGLLIPFCFLAGTALGLATGWYWLTGTALTLGCFSFMPRHFALPSSLLWVPLGYLWCDVMCATQGMAILGAPIGIGACFFAGIAIVFFGDIYYASCRPRRKDYLLLAQAIGEE